MKPRVVTAQQFGEIFAMPTHTVLRRIRRGVIRALDIGTPRHPVYRIPITEVDRFEREALAKAQPRSLRRVV